MEVQWIEMENRMKKRKQNEKWKAKWNGNGIGMEMNRKEWKANEIKWNIDEKK